MSGCRPSVDPPPKTAKMHHSARHPLPPTHHLWPVPVCHITTQPSVHPTIYGWRRPTPVCHSTKPLWVVIRQRCTEQGHGDYRKRHPSQRFYSVWVSTICQTPPQPKTAKMHQSARHPLPPTAQMHPSFVARSSMSQHDPALCAPNHLWVASTTQSVTVPSQSGGDQANMQSEQGCGSCRKDTPVRDVPDPPSQDCIDAPVCQALLPTYCPDAPMVCRRRSPQSVTAPSHSGW